MDDGSQSHKALTQDLLTCIRRIDRNETAQRSAPCCKPIPMYWRSPPLSDTGRTKPHGPLYGILVLLKDNIDTGGEQTTTGSLARSVADAAALLSLIAGSDPRDPATADDDQYATDYAKFLDPNGPHGKRIGVVRTLAGAETSADRVLDEAIAAMMAQGTIIVAPLQLSHLDELGKLQTTVLQYDSKHDINAYPATRTGLKVHTPANLIAFNDAHAAVTGHPSLTLPAGWTQGLPAGILLFGAKWSELTLISIAYGFEQHTHAWQVPRFLDTMDGRPVMASPKQRQDV